MGDYKKCGSVVIEGKKRTLYEKAGTTKKYVQRKGRMMNVVKYRKMVAKKAAVATPVKRVNKARKTPKRRGGYAEAEESKGGNLLENALKHINM
jgi:hypothetical protein